MGEMSWFGKKIHLYNVTMGLYMLDWWERCLFSLGWVLVLFVRGQKKEIYSRFSQTFLILSRLPAFRPVMSSVIIDFVYHIKFPSKEAELKSKKRKEEAELMQILVSFIWLALGMFILNWSRHINAGPALVRLPQQFTIRH